MQKQKKRKFLGTVWTAEISKKEERGITLIALIITIIVMIILVGVTVTVALNGGLFSTAKQAAEETQYQADYETLQAAVIAAMASEEGIIQESLQENLPSDWTVTEKESGTYTAKSPNGNVFEVDSNGSITSQTGEETEDEDLAFLKKYFLGENEEGKDFWGLTSTTYDETTDEGITTFIDDETTEINESEEIIILDSGYGNPYVWYDEENNLYYSYNYYIKYNKKVYSVGIIRDSGNGDTYVTTSVELKYTPYGREGDTYLYDVDGDGTKEECTILYDYGEGQGIEIVSPIVIGDKITLGRNDSTVDWEDEDVIEEADLDGDNSLTNVEKAIYSYNHAIETLNNYAKEQVTKLNSSIDADNVRSVGSNPSDPYSENDSMYTFTRIEGLDLIYNEAAKSGDTNYEQDLIRMSYYGVADIGSSYWLASRYVGDFKYRAHLSIGHMTTDGFMNYGDYNGHLCQLYNGSAYGESYSYNVRPVIKIDGV